MDLSNIGGAVTSYFVAALAIVADTDLYVFLGFCLLIVRLVYEALRLVKYIKDWMEERQYGK